MELVKRLFNEEEGQGMIEYVLIAALISIVAIGALRLAGVQVGAIWTSVVSAITP